MKHIYTFVLIIFIIFSSGCKKYIQQQEEKAVIAAVTNGIWYVSQYLKNDSDITASFSGYRFKFDANGIVTGTKDSYSLKGIWTADIPAREIFSSFPTAGAPLNYLNKTWKIKDSYTNFVSANSTDSISQTTNILQLQKE